MILPPLVVNVHIHEKDERNVRVWLPLFLLWPLLLLILALVLVFTLVADIASFFAGARYHHYTLLVLRALRLLAEARGTHARINNPTTRVAVDIY